MVNLTIKIYTKKMNSQIYFILTFLTVFMLFPQTPCYSFNKSARVIRKGGNLWNTLSYPSEYDIEENLSKYDLSLKSLKYRPFLPKSEKNLSVSSKLISNLVISQIQAITAYNHIGQGSGQSRIADTNVATVSKYLARSLAEKFDFKIRIAGNEGEISEDLKAFQAGNIINSDGKEKMMLEIDGIEGTMFLLSGRQVHFPYRKAYEQGAWSMVSLMKDSNELSGDMYRLTVAYNGETKEMNLNSNSVEKIVEKIAIGMGYEGYNDSDFKNEVKMVLLHRPRHHELIEKFDKLGLDTQTLIHGDCLPIIAASSGVEVDGKKLVVVNAGGSHEEYIARAFSKNISQGVQISQYVSSEVENILKQPDFTRSEIEQLKQLGIYDPYKIESQNSIKGNPIVALTSITGMRKDLFSKLASQFPGVKINEDTGEIQLTSLVSTKQGVFIVQGNYTANDSIKAIKRKLQLDNVFYPEPEIIDQIISDVKAKWKSPEENMAQSNFEKLSQSLDAEGLPSFTAFDDYSTKWLNLYLDTVLSSETLSDTQKDIREFVLLMKKITDSDSFSELLKDQQIKNNTKLSNLIENLRYDISREDFNDLMPQEKEKVLDVVAKELSPKDRYWFYIAFQPKMYETFQKLTESSREEALRAFDNQKKIYSNNLEVEVEFSKERLPLKSLIPTHQVSTELGMGSTSFRNRLDEIDKGMFVPLLVLSIRGKNYIMDGHARALAYLEKGVEKVPVFRITVKNPPFETIHNMRSSTKKQGLVSIEDVKRQPLEIPETTNLEKLSTPTLVAEDMEEFRNFTGIAFMKSIVDSVRDKNAANVFFDISMLDYLKETSKVQKNFKLYLENADNVNLFVKVPKDISTEKKEEKLSEVEKIAIKFGFDKENVHLFSKTNKINKKVKEVGGIDIGLVDLIKLKDFSSYVHEIQDLDKTKLLTLVFGKEQRLILREILEEKPIIKNIIESSDNLLIGDKSSLRSLLPEEEGTATNVIQLQNLDSPEKEMEPVLDTVEMVVNQTKRYNKAALIAVDGWAGAGRDTVINIIKESLRKKGKDYKSTMLNLNDYRLSVGKARSETKVDIPQIGTTVTTDIDIDIHREDSDSMTVITSFDKTKVKLPIVGQEVKVKNHAIYISRPNEDTLSVRLAPIITNVELGRFYRDIQRLNNKEPIYVPLWIKNHKVTIPEKERTKLVDGLFKMGEPVFTLDGKKVMRYPVPKDNWAKNKSASSFWFNITNGEVLYKLNPDDFDIIYIRGKLTLHQRNINSLYDLAMFVDADYPTRLERIVREHIFENKYPDKSISEVKEYMENQRTILEDQYLFEDRSRADYVLVNKFYPDEKLLSNFYKMDLSERVDRVIEIVNKEINNPSIETLKHYILPVIGKGNDLRKSISFILDLKENQPDIEISSKIETRLEKSESPFDDLNEKEENLLYKILNRMTDLEFDSP